MRSTLRHSCPGVRNGAGRTTSVESEKSITSFTSRSSYVARVEQVTSQLRGVAQFLISWPEETVETSSHLRGTDRAGISKLKKLTRENRCKKQAEFSASRSMRLLRNIVTGLIIVGLRAGKVRIFDQIGGCKSHSLRPLRGVWLIFEAALMSSSQVS